MPPSAAMLDHLASNLTFLCPIWMMTATDSTVAAYAAHTRSLTFSSQLYTAAPVEPTRFNQSLGVSKANNVELFGVLDNVVTEADIQGGRWKNARMTFQYVNYLDLTMGSVGLMKGRAGAFSINNGTFRVEFRSLSSLLTQEIGDLTSPVSRQRTLEDLVGAGSIGTYTFPRSVSAVTSRSVFTVGSTAFANDYLAYGKVTFTSGANSGRSMEIKTNVGNLITLQLPMMSDIAIGNNVSLIAGWDGSRDQARDKFSAAANIAAEPDLPGIRAILSYPE